ncbi:ribose-5-phosphate isomerase A [Lactobacillus selangorensis]|uniref:Ribose-5-phosphate isomerase A n=1 Tax=Lactobacillus selangorensis TaxID=81857 RepID=A0A0R2G3L7_9LACO|nr:ribose-5-phosphate isomerase RpiA [Lactobacillus selangorensis]KRN29182.1 ribose-5-phosphate isomerase A [Lactobacillus selangorensis]KRN31460.1 ribose-5-phosphate isomerase A [Lactobacillus selangorensis]
MDQNELKKMAGRKAAEFVHDDMILGLGTGSTVRYMVEAVAERVKNESLHITGVATSRRTRDQAEKLGIHMKSVDEVPYIDVTIDGADEIDKNFQGIKGGGAAHTMEKIVATASNQNIWIVDESKIVDQLGRFPLPTEVIPYGSTKVFQRLADEGLHPRFRLNEDGTRVTTHSKNYVIDLHMKQIQHPHLLQDWLIRQVGIVEQGLFLDLVNKVVVGTQDGPKVLDAHR